MGNKVIAVAIVAILVISGVGIAFVLDLVGDSNKDNPLAGETRIDAMGREVIIPKNLDNGIVTIGSGGPLRFLSIFDMYDKVIEVDQGDVTDLKHGRAYSYAYPYDEFTPDRYHPDNALEAETVEQIGKKGPSLIIVQSTVYENYKDNCDILAKSFPLIVIWPQSLHELWKDDHTLSDWYVNTVKLIGDMVGKPERADEHIADVNAILADIRSLVNVTPEKKSVFVAGLTIRGSNELTTTFPTYLPLDLVDGKNAYDGNQNVDRVDMDPEEVAELDIDMIVIDPSSSDKLDTVNSQTVMKWLYDINNDDDPGNDIPIFITMPMVWDMANYDCVLAGAYYLAHLLYGTLTLDEVEKRIVEVFEAYYGDAGTEVFDSMKEFFDEKSDNNEQEMPLLGKVKVDKIDDSRYRFVAA